MTRRGSEQFRWTSEEIATLRDMAGRVPATSSRRQSAWACPCAAT